MCGYSLGILSEGSSTDSGIVDRVHHCITYVAAVGCEVKSICKQAEVCVAWLLSSDLSI